MRLFDDPKPPAEKRKQQLIYLLPSLKAEIEKRRIAAGQSRSEWIERAIRAALARKA
jgi:metal-responsive CopG/Arc/MetJ family transcriptional regulator